MGSIMGGLYAAGYSGKELRRLVLSTDWESILSDELPYDQILLREKPLYGGYFFVLPIENFSITLPLSFMRVHRLQSLFHHLTIHTRNIRSFDSLYIPFRCIAADIGTGEEVILKEGNLALAMRASMAIPLVYYPVYIDGRLLVDGGLLNNFPVNVVKEMGAEFVIGSYTGFRLLSGEEITNGARLFAQTQSISLLPQALEAMKETDILINSVDSLKAEAAQDFNEMAQILKRGEEAVQKVMPQLIALAEAQQKSGRKQKSRTAIAQQIQKKHTEKFKVNSVRVEGSKRQQNLIEKSLYFNKKRDYSLEEINKKVNRLYGTQQFDQIAYSVSGKPENAMLFVQPLQASQSHLLLNINYSSIELATLSVGVVSRDLFLNRSRFVFVAALGEYSRIWGNYQKYLGNSSLFRLKISGSHLQRPTKGHIRSGEVVEETILYNNDIELGGIFSLQENVELFVGSKLQISSFSPRLSPRPKEKEILFRKLSISLFSHYAEFTWNNLNHRYYPTKGVYLNVHGEIRTNNRILYQWAVGDSVANKITSTDISPLAYIGMSGQFKTWLPIFSDRLSWGLRGHVGNGINIGGEKQIIGDFNSFFIGGMRATPHISPTVAFAGLQPAEVDVRRFALAETSLRTRFVGKAYLTMRVNSLLLALPEAINEFLLVHGGGLLLSWLTPLGPLEVGVATNLFNNAFSFYISFGHY